MGGGLKFEAFPQHGAQGRAHRWVEFFDGFLQQGCESPIELAAPAPDARHDLTCEGANRDFEVVPVERREIGFFGGDEGANDFAAGESARVLNGVQSDSPTVKRAPRAQSPALILALPGA